MVSRLSLFTNLLLVPAALAVPSHLDVGLAGRSEDGQSQYTTNWAGAGTFTTVTGTFTVPTLSGSDDSASAWVGIDGATCQNTLQTGVEFTISEGKAYYNVWYEWYPDGLNYLPEIQVSAGDVINATVAAYSTTSGSVIIENLTQGEIAILYLASSNALCLQNAEWIVQDPSEANGNFAAFSDFGSVTFSDAIASDTNDHRYTPSDGTIFDIKQNGRVLTSSHASGSSVTVEYV